MLKLQATSELIRHSPLLDAGYQPEGSPAIGSIPYEAPIMYWAFRRMTMRDEVKNARKREIVSVFYFDSASLAALSNPVPRT